MKNKQIDHMSNIKNKTSPSFFQNTRKTENVPNLNFKYLRAHPWGLHTCKLYIVTTSASDFKQL